jgi:hypothetical protein
MPPRRTPDDCDELARSSGSRASFWPVVCFLAGCAPPPDGSNPGADSTPSVDDTAAPTIADVSIANPYAPANTMMYAVTVTASSHGADAAHDATVGFARRGTDCETGTWMMGPVKRFETEDALTWILYNFKPGDPYDYKVQLGSEIQCGELGSPALPASLGALNLTFTKGQHQSNYLLFDTDDCAADPKLGGQRYLLAVDPALESIVWYLDVAGRSTIGGSDLSGWRYQSDRFLATVDKRYFYEWAWDGSVITAKDVAGGGCDGTDAYGPCIHHDAYRSEASGKTYVVASEQSALDGVGTNWDVCGGGSRFLDDGFQVWSEDFSTVDTHLLMRDYGYDPHQDGGPNVADQEPDGACDASLWSNYFDPYGTIDWIHLNSIAASTSDGTELLDLSIKEWDQVVRIDENGGVVWRLSPHAAYSDWGLRISPDLAGPASFGAQHDVHPISTDSLLMFDNTGDVAGSRVLRLNLAGDIATIDRSWVVVDASGNALTCRVEGSAQLVPYTDGARVVAMCNDAFTVVELVDASGNASVPPLAVSLPEKGFCAEGGPELRQGLRGWYRAFPVDRLGDF